MSDDILLYINRLVAKHVRTIRNIVARGELSVADDGPKMQTGQIKLLDGEMIDGAERTQQYGFSSHPHPGAEVFVVFCNADRSHPLVVAVDDRRYRMGKTKVGEVIIYTDEGDFIHFQRDNTIEIKTKHLIINAEDDVTVNTKKFEVNAEDTATITTKDMTLTGSNRIGLHTPNLTMGGTEGGKTTATFTGDINQDGQHTSTGDQVAGGVSQITHPHEDAGGVGPSGPPIAG